MVIAEVPTRGIDLRGRRGIDVGLITILVGLTLWRLIPAISDTEFHRDEARWLHNSTLLSDWADPLGIIWQDEGYEDVYGTIDEQNRRRSQPPFAMYVLGIGGLIQRGELPDNGYWIMSQNTEWNVSKGNMPSQAELRAGRRTDVAIAVLTVIGLYFIGMLATNRVGGFVTGFIFAVHPLVVNTASRAWSDPLLALCIVLSGLAGYWLVKKPGWGRAILLGVTFGMGASTKLSPLAVAGVVGFLGIALLLWSFLHREGRRWTRKLGLRLIAVPVFAFATFVALYPYLWTDPIDHTRAMFDFRTESFDLQGISFPPAKVEDRADAFRRIGDELGRRFSAGGWIGDELDSLIGSGDWAALRNLDLGLAVIGWLIVVGLMTTRGMGWPPALMLGIIGVQACAVIFGMKVEYARYLLPVLLAVAVGAGVTIGYVWEQVRSFRTRPSEEFGTHATSSPIPVASL